MKTLLRYSLTVLVAAIALTSCRNNTPKEAKYIPKDAAFVLVLDPQQLQDKLQKGGIGIDTLIAHFFQNEPADSKERADFNKFRDSIGIDWNSKLVAFMMTKANADKSSSMTFSCISTLKDVSKFEAFLKTEDKLKNSPVKEEKDYKYITHGDQGMLAWNKEHLIFTIYNHQQKAEFDTTTMTFKQPAPADNDAALKSTVNRYFTQKPSESLADVSNFTDMFKEKADGYFFTSGNSTLSSLSMLPFQPPKLEEMLKDNYSTATLSFEDGKIVAKSFVYPNALLSSVLKQYAGPTVKTSMIEHYPSQNINMVMLASFNPEIFGGLLKQLDVEGMANNFLSTTGLTTQDIYKCLKGDIAVVVSDINAATPEPEMKRDEKTMTHKKFGKMLLDAPVGDKAGFRKIMDLAVAHGFLVKDGNAYKGGALASLFGIFIRADENSLTISSDSLTYAQYKSNTYKATIDKDVLDKFSGKSVVFYGNIAGTLDNFAKDSSASLHHSFTAARETFKDVIITSDNFDGKTIKGSFEIRMQNQKQNSLVTLTSLITHIAVDMRAQAKLEKENASKMFPGGVPAIIRTN